MDLLLVSPRIAVQKGDYLGSGVPYWPIELAVLAGFARERGCGVTVWDSLGNGPDVFESVGDHFLQGRGMNRWLQLHGVPQCDAVIFYAMSSMSHSDILGSITALRAAGYTKTVAVLENSQAVTAYALPHVSGEFFSAGADLLICGEAYWNWPELLAALQDPARSQAANCISKSAAPPREVRRLIQLKDPAYPIPAWDLFALAGYWRLPYSHGPKTPTFLPILTSRGCPYPCDFCVVPETNDRKWRGRSPEEVVKEMTELHQRTGVVDFQIEDLNPTVNTKRWRRIAELLVEANLGIRYYIVSGTKAETLSLDDIPLYAASGCRYFSISPESGSEAVMKAIGKPFDYEQGRRVVELCHRHGIRTQACFIVGHPSETEDDHRQSRDYLRQLLRLGLDETAIFIVAPLAGSRLQQDSRIAFADPQAMVSFSPKGRADWPVLARRRRELITDFFWGKLRQGPALWGQLYRAVAGRPETKVENLFRRVIFVLYHTTRARLRPHHA